VHGSSTVAVAFPRPELYDEPDVAVTQRHRVERR
jgi:hypothetical protein